MSAGGIAHLLVFGGEGQLGRELRQAALPAGWSLRALARYEADLTRPAELERAVAASRPDAVINAAAYTAVVAQ